MFLRHIQLMFSSLVKTLKIEKCFVARKQFPDKLACRFHHSAGLKQSVNKRNGKKYPEKSGNSRLVCPFPGDFLLCICLFFCCNKAQVTIFSGTCAELAPCEIVHC